MSLHHFPEAEFEGTARRGRRLGARIEDWWRTVDDAFLQIDDDQARLARDTEKEGAPRRVASSTATSGETISSPADAGTRSDACSCTNDGFLKILVVPRKLPPDLLAHSAFASLSRRLLVKPVSARHLAVPRARDHQKAARWRLVAKDTPRHLRASDVPPSFWAFFAAVHFSLLFPSLYLFIEACACCVDERRARFGLGKRRRRTTPKIGAPPRGRGSSREKTLAAKPRSSDRSRARKRTAAPSSSSAVARDAQTYHNNSASESNPGAFPPLQRVDTAKEPAAWRGSRRGARVVYVERRTAEDAFRSRVRVRKALFFAKVLQYARHVTPARQNARVFNQQHA